MDASSCRRATMKTPCCTLPWLRVCVTDERKYVTVERESVTVEIESVTVEREYVTAERVRYH